MSKSEINQRIDELEMLLFDYEDKQHITDSESKEEKLIDEVAEAIRSLRRFYKEQKDKNDKSSIDIDEGYKYVIGIRANVAHKM